MPTKTTKTTKSLVVVLRFCSKLGSRGKRDFVLRNPRPPCALLAGVAMHTGRGRYCTGREKRVKRKKAGKAPGAECQGKAFAPIACANRGQRHMPFLSPYSPQERLFSQTYIYITHMPFCHADVICQCRRVLGNDFCAF